MFKSKRSKIFLLLTFIFGVLLFWINVYLIPNYIVKIRSNNLSNSTYKCQFEKEKIEFQSSDNLTLKAYLQSSKIKKDLVVILVHGIRSDASQFCEKQNILIQNDIASVAIDLRAHGTSEGVYCTFGAKEKDDISNLISILKKRGFSKFGIWGQSIGGAVAIQAIEYDNNLSFGIIESTFTTYELIVKDYIKDIIGFNVWRVEDYWINRAASKAGFTKDNVQPIQSCKNIKVPMFMIHGTDDKRISIEYGKANFNALSSINKKWKAIDGANHFNVTKVGGEELLVEILAFIKKNS